MYIKPWVEVFLPKQAICVLTTFSTESGVEDFNQVEELG